MATMTVREAILFSARLRLPRSMSLAHKTLRVQQVSLSPPPHPPSFVYCVCGGKVEGLGAARPGCCPLLVAQVLLWHVKTTRL